MSAVLKCKECGEAIEAGKKHACASAEGTTATAVAADVGSSILEGIGSVLDVTGGAIGSAAEVAGDVLGAVAEVTGAVLGAAISD